MMSDDLCRTVSMAPVPAPVPAPSAEEGVPAPAPAPILPDVRYATIVEETDAGEQCLLHNKENYVSTCTSAELPASNVRTCALHFETTLLTAVECAKLCGQFVDISKDKNLHTLNVGQCAIWGASLWFRVPDQEDGTRVYQQHFLNTLPDAKGGKPTGENAKLTECSKFGERHIYRSGIQEVKKFDDGTKFYVAICTVGHQSYKLFTTEPKSNGHPKFGHAHALRYIYSSIQAFTTVVYGRKTVLRGQKVDDDIFVIPHLQMVPVKYHLALDIELTQQLFDATVKIVKIGSSLVPTVLQFHEHLGVLESV
jgi:hypothetical protein